MNHDNGCSAAARASVLIIGLAAATVALAQMPPGGRLPPPSREPQLSGCVGPDGKLLAMTLDLNLAATATGPFSVALNWTGPAAQYQLTGPHMSASVAISPSMLAPSIGDRVIRTPGRLPAGTIAPSQPASGSATFTFSRPQHLLLPDFAYGFKVEATLPDGTRVCDTASARTPPASIAPLQSAFFAPDDLRVGFVLPPYVDELNIYRLGHTEDGRQPPFDKRVLQEVMQPPPSAQATFEVRGVGRRVHDSRKRVNPGLPPLPANYSQPPVYQLAVEAIWRDGAGRSSVTRAPVRVDGPLPLRGWADLHTHPMSHLAFGGKIFHGAPDAGSLLPALSVPTSPPIAGLPAPPFGCLVQPNLRAADINQALADDSPTHGDPVQSVCGDVLRKAVIVGMEMNKGVPQPGRRMGAPVFDAWPSWNDIAHQKMWVDWIRRAYDGGLRVLVGLSHNNRLLAELAKGQCSDPARPCLRTDDLASSDLQIMEMKDFVARHADFMEVALTAADLHRIVNGDPSRGIAPKLAVVLGVEIDNIGNFRLQSPPSAQQITSELTRLHSQGVRYIFPVHVTDNVFGGTAPYNNLFNVANVFETNHWWDVECAGAPPYADDEIGFTTPNITVLNEIPHPFNTVIPQGVQLPASPQNCRPGSGHRNKKGLNYTRFASPPAGANPGIGEFALKEMMRLGFIIDIDHMSHRTAEEVLGIAERVAGGGYPLMSGHSGIRDLGHFNAENSRTRSQLGRIGCLGGMFGLGTDHAEARNWAVQYQDALQVIRHRSPSCLYKEVGFGAVALGTDVNSLVQSPKPLLDNAEQLDRQLNVYTAAVSNARGTFRRFPESPSATGAKVWDLRRDGVAHYGMYADFIKAVWSFPFDQNRGMRISGQELVENHLDRNADNFWRMWVKVEQQKGSVRH